MINKSSYSNIGGRPLKFVLKGVYLLLFIIYKYTIESFVKYEPCKAEEDVIKFNKVFG